MPDNAFVPATGIVTRWWAPWALPVSAPPARDVVIGMVDGRIVELEAGVPRAEAVARAGVELFDDCVVAPGFVNAHAHIEYAAYGALVDGLSFAGWISDHMRRKARLAPEHMRASANLGALSALYAGITCIGDASFSGDAAHAMHDAGLRGRVYLEVFGGIDDAAAAGAVDACLQRLDQLPSSPLLGRGLSPHAPYTVGEPLYRRVAATGMPWMTHFLESPDELLFYRGRGELATVFAERGYATPAWSQSPVCALADILGPHVVGVHLVHARPEDYEVLAAAGVGVAHCPRSNARLGCGLFDLGAAERAGLTLGLGTDSPSSAGPIDPFAEMRTALELHRARGAQHDQPSAAHVHDMATRGAARVLGYGELGTLDIGARADVIAVHVGRCADPHAAFVLGGTPGDVRAVLVGGRDAGVRDRTRLQRAHERADEARRLLALPVPGSSAGRQPVRN